MYLLEILKGNKANSFAQWDFFVAGHSCVKNVYPAAAFSVREQKKVTGNNISRKQSLSDGMCWVFGQKLAYMTRCVCLKIQRFWHNLHFNTSIDPEEILSWSSMYLMGKQPQFSPLNRRHPHYWMLKGWTVKGFFKSGHTAPFECFISHISDSQSLCRLLVILYHKQRILIRNIVRNTAHSLYTFW